MKVILLLATVALSGCQSHYWEQKAGTELVTTDDKTKLVTYVTPEEYERMSEAERQRLNATVGVSGTLATWGKPKSQTREVTAQELDAAKKKAAR